MLESKEKAVLDLIGQDKSYEDYFFEKVTDIKWFQYLKQEGYFSPNRAPSPEPTKEKGYFVIPQWNVLPYLERISKYVSEGEDGKYASELLNIIIDVSTYKDDNGEHIDNWRTWYYFIRIISSIPSNLVPIEIFDFLRIWLNSRFDNISLGYEIIDRLLPKFFNDDSTEYDLKKAERIIKIITDIQTSPETTQVNTLSSYTDNKRLTLNAEQIEEIVSRYSDYIGRKCSRSVIDDLVGKIETLLHTKISREIITINGNLYELSLLDEDSNYTLSICQIKQSKSCSSATGVKDKRIPITKVIVEKGSLQKVEQNIYENMMTNRFLQDMGETTFKVMVCRLYYGLYNAGTYYSLHEAPKYLYDDALELLTYVLKAFLISKARTNVFLTKQILKDLLNRHYIFFHKMVLYIIAQDLKEYEDLFWEYLMSEQGDYVFASNAAGDELRHVLTNLTSLTDKNRRLLEEKIDRGPLCLSSDEENEQRVAIWRQARYQALSHDIYFRKLCNELRHRTGVDAQLMPIVSQITVREEREVAPLAKEDLLSMTNIQIADYFNNFVTLDKWKGPNVSGLASLVEVVAQEQPDKFISDLSPFLRSPYFYICSMLTGFRKAWSSKTLITWDKLLSFCCEYINRDEFWNDTFTLNDDAWSGSGREFVGAVGSLIQEGTKDDKWLMGQEHFEKVKDLFIIILERLPIDNRKEVDDPVTYVLNSPLGKVLTAVIYLEFQIAYLKRAHTQLIEWTDELKRKYIELLNGDVIESHVLFGQYLDIMYDLDESWTKEMICTLEHTDKEGSWNGFMFGYLFNSNLRLELYQLMNNNYLRALNGKRQSDSFDELLLRHICLAYVIDFDSSSECSLFEILLNRGKPFDLLQIIQFFWVFSRGISVNDSLEILNTDVQDKVISFWKRVYERYNELKENESLSEDNKKVLSDLTKLIVYLRELDENNVNWLRLSAPYATINYNSPILFRHLNKLKDSGERARTARWIGDLVERLLDGAYEYAAMSPAYDKEDIKSILIFLFESGDDIARTHANEICHIYGQKGVRFVQDIFNMYNPVV